MRRQLPLALVFIFGVFMIVQYFVPHEYSEWIYEFLLDWITIIGIFALALGIYSLSHVSVDKIRTRKPNWQYAVVTMLGLFVMVYFGFTSRVGDSWGLYFVALIALVLGISFLTWGAIERQAARRKIGFIAGLAMLATFVLVAVFDPTWKFFFYTSEGLQSAMFRNFFDYIMIPIQSTMFSLLAFFIASAAYRAFRARNVLATLLLASALIVMLRFNPFLGPVGEYIAQTANWLLNVPNLAAKRAIVIGIGLGIVATALKVILGIERGYMGRG